MKKYSIALIIICGCTFSGLSQETTTKATDTYPVYSGNDLGCVYTKSKTKIRVFAPTAEEFKLKLYDKGIGGNLIKEFPFQKGINGTWIVELQGDYLGKFYTVQAKINGKWRNEVTDPYAKAVGVNGDRVQIVDFSQTNPQGWEKDKSPVYTMDSSQQDAIIYELHIRDASMSASSGIKQKGKFLGLTELNTKNNHQQSTGLQHIKELGVTHVHLLPVFDFNSVNETQLNLAAYNWGYDPKNYNTPEGSYSTNPYDATVRIREFKSMVSAIHKAGLSIVMDVVYNHTAVSRASNFNQLVPGYYYRMKNDSTFADASACGNETASEKPMMRKFMIESLVNWVKEYHVDGFRFDLMAIHDIETMNQISAALKEIKPDILIYGEGWAASNPYMDQEKMAFKRNVSRLNNIAVFSDDIRDGIKGYVFDEKAKGFVNGNPALTETVKFGIVGALAHPQVKMGKAFYDKVPYARKPAQVINYADCHDNLTLWDKIGVSVPDASREDKVRMQEMALGLVITSQGIPFMLAGTEFHRSKQGVENSFNRPDSINAVDWNLKFTNNKTYQYVQEIIRIRKSHPLFRLRTSQAITEQLSFLETPEGLIAYTIERKQEKDNWKKIMVVCNGLNSKQQVTLPAGEWKIALDNSDLTSVANGLFNVPRLSFIILYQD
jgi:pullulanase